MPVVLAGYRRAQLPDAFAVQLVHRLRDQDPRITPALTWLDQRLAAQGTTADAVVRDEHQRQGAATVTVRNIITSMRMISDVDWTELFERISLVDDVLAAGRRFSRHGFPDAQSLPQRHRGAGARLRPHRDSRSRAAPSWPRSKPHMQARASWKAGRAIPAIIFSAEVAPRSRRRSASGRRLTLGSDELSRALGIGGYVGAVAIAAAVLLALPLFALAAVGLHGAWLSLLGWPGCDSRHRRGSRAGEPRRDTAALAPRSFPLWPCATACPRICARSSRCRRC